MNNKVLALACLIFLINLAGCQTTQTPYEVNASIPYKKNRPSNLYDFGVTEEKVNDRIYYVTVKLTGTSSTDRAIDMFYLHAANLAVKNNFSKFATEKRRGGRWCSGTKNNYTGQKSTDDGGPKFSGFVLLLNDKSEVTSKQKIYTAQQMISKKQAKVGVLIDEATMLANEKRYMEACSGRS